MTSISSLLTALYDLTRSPDFQVIDLFAEDAFAVGPFGYSEIARRLAPREYDVWSEHGCVDAAEADSASVRGSYDPERAAPRGREIREALENALRSSPALLAVLQEAIQTRCRETGADPAPALARLAFEIPTEAPCATTGASMAIECELFVPL
jgi:hypothetical protein